MSGHEPAFPQPIDDMGTLRSVTEGVSIRTYLAAKAFAAILQTTGQSPSDAKLPWVQQGLTHHKWTAICAVEYADALLAELSKTP